MNDNPCCRYCLDDWGRLIQPCNCSGTQAWIHRDCLDEWRVTEIGGRRFNQCDVCKFNYGYKKVYRNLWHKKFFVHMAYHIILNISVILVVGLPPLALFHFIGLIQIVSDKLNLSYTLSIFLIGCLGFFLTIGTLAYCRVVVRLRYRSIMILLFLVYPLIFGIKGSISYFYDDIKDTVNRYKLLKLIRVVDQTSNKERYGTSIGGFEGSD